MEDGQPAHARVEDADRPSIHAAILRSGLRWADEGAAGGRVRGARPGSGRARRHPAGLYTKTDQIVTMDDGVGLATTLYAPVTHGERWPAVMLFHGLGGNRQSLDRIATLFAQRGYIALTFDSAATASRAGSSRRSAPASSSTSRGCARPGAGERAGRRGQGRRVGHLARRRRSASRRRRGDAVQGDRGRRDVDRPLRSARAAGPPEDRRDLSVSRCRPARTAGAGGPRDPASGREPRRRRRCARSRWRARRGNCSRAGTRRRSSCRAAATSRSASSRASPGGSATPGPKGLYVGAFGHSPSTFPGPDFELVMQRVLQWFDVHVAGSPDTPNRPAVELANESGTAVKGYAGLPPTARHVYSLRGTATIGAVGQGRPPRARAAHARDVRRSDRAGACVVRDRLVAPRRGARRPHARAARRSSSARAACRRA